MSLTYFIEKEREEIFLKTRIFSLQEPALKFDLSSCEIFSDTFSDDVGFSHSLRNIFIRTRSSQGNIRQQHVTQFTNDSDTHLRVFSEIELTEATSLVPFLTFSFRRYAPLDTSFCDSICLDIIMESISYAIVSIREALNSVNPDSEELARAQERIKTKIGILGIKTSYYAAYSKFMYTLRTLNLSLYFNQFDDIDIDSDSVDLVTTELKGLEIQSKDVKEYLWTMAFAPCEFHLHLTSLSPSDLTNVGVLKGIWSAIENEKVKWVNDEDVSFRESEMV